MDIGIRFSIKNDPRSKVPSINGKIFLGEKASVLVVLAEFLQNIFGMWKEKLPRPTKIGERLSALATDIHSASECNCCYGGLVKTQRVYGIVRHIEKVLKAGNKVKTSRF
jgi:hypothetical protein